MYPLAVAIVGLLIFGGGCWYRARRAKPIDRAFSTKHVMTSLAGASAVVLGFFPVSWLLVSHAVWGGPIETSLAPGVSVDALLGLLVVGVFIAVVHAFYSLIEHLNS